MLYGRRRIGKSTLLPWAAESQTPFTRKAGGPFWRLKLDQPHVLMIPEGGFDMLAMAQALHARDLPRSLPLYTKGEVGLV